MSDHLNKLINSVHFQSILKEQSVFNVVKQHLPDTQMGTFYVDPDTSKYREIDVLALKESTINQKSEEIRVRTIIPIECKTLKNFSVFLYNEQPKEKSRPNTVWPLEILQTTIFQKIHRESLSLKVQKRFELEHSNTRPKLTDQIDLAASFAEPVFPTYASFREMNPANVRRKDDDGSVVWEASQSLRACQMYFVNEVIKTAVEDSIEQMAGFIDEVDKARDATYTRIPLIRLDAIKALHNRFYSIHPILVVDAQLFTIDENENPKEISAGNLAFYGVGGFANFQMTVMRYSTFQESIAALIKGILI